jgi:hypothetical protein
LVWFNFKPFPHALESYAYCPLFAKAQSCKIMSRLQDFRAYMEKMNPVADPIAAIEQDLYVFPPYSIADQLGARLELEPNSQCLLVGGIGCGKTSELLRLQYLLNERFQEVGDTVFYADISKFHNLDSKKSLKGVLTAVAGLLLVNSSEKCASKEGKEFIDMEVKEAINKVNRFAKGYMIFIDHYDQDDYPGDDLDYIHGALVSPSPPIPEEYADLIGALRLLHSTISQEGTHTVFLFDSLDRLPKPMRFHECIVDDLRVLKAAGIGAAVVGPPRIMSGQSNDVVNLFDLFMFQTAYDPNLTDDLVFLKSILRKRANSEILPDICLEPLAKASGGILRDLIALAKSAGDTAYAAGHDYIQLEDVHKAINLLGRNLALGLDDKQLETLSLLFENGIFVVRGEQELLLIESRRVILYEETRWRVHPSLSAILKSIIEAT